MSVLSLPCSIFQTQKRMNDYGAPDMRYGDLSSQALKSVFHLANISERVDPWTLTLKSSFDRPQSMYCCNLRGPGKKISRQQCASILFDEFRSLAWPYAVYGPYRHLINEMINHLQHGNGAPFRSLRLNEALRSHILGDKTENSSLLRIQDALDENIDWENRNFLSGKANAINSIKEAILGGRLPKFNRWQDNFNGMGITVHDTWATHITLSALHIGRDSYRARLHYRVQDHFGLDDGDIRKSKFNQFRFFRIWFVLQRYRQFGFRPFLTNLEASVEINGGRYEKRK